VDSNFRFDSTKDLLDICSTPEDAAEYVVANQACRAFIEAYVQYHDEISSRKNLKRLVCYPPTTTIADGKLTFVAWAKGQSANQKLMAEQPVIGLVRALAAEYPCKKG
jgi:phosphoribosylaminoimidazole carboxylase (NCAIR synthetase)